VITVEIATAIIIEIATAMIVIQTGTAMAAMTGIEVGIGEIAIAAIGTVIDSRSNDNFRESSTSTALALGLIERQSHHLGRILSAHGIKLVLV
jgi:hypothetical protein